MDSIQTVTLTKQFAGLGLDSPREKHNGRLEKNPIAILSPYLGQREVAACCRVSKSWLQGAEKAPWFAMQAARVGITDRLRGSRSWREALIYYAISIYLKPRPARSIAAVEGMVALYRAASRDYRLAFRDGRYYCDRFSKDGMVTEWSVEAPSGTVSFNAFPAARESLLLLAIQEDGSAHTAGWDGKIGTQPTRWQENVRLFSHLPTRILDESCACNGTAYAISAFNKRPKKSESIAYGLCLGHRLQPPVGYVHGERVRVVGLPSRDGLSRFIFEVTCHLKEKISLRWFDETGRFVHESRTYRKVYRTDHVLAGANSDILFSFLKRQEGESVIMYCLASSAKDGASIRHMRFPDLEPGLLRTFCGFSCSGHPAALITNLSEGYYGVICLVNNEFRLSFLPNENRMVLPHLPELGLFFARDEDGVHLARFILRQNGLKLMKIGDISSDVTDLKALDPIVYDEGAEQYDSVYAYGARDLWMSEHDST